MKSLSCIFVSMMALAALSACSQGSSNSAPGVKDYQAQKVPPNALSQEDIKELGAVINASKAFLPDDSAVFKTILKGTEVEEVSYEKKEKAISDLNETGQHYLSKIKKSCAVRDAQKQVTGAAEQGSTQSTQVEMSVAAKLNDCPISVRSSYQQSTYFRQINIGANSASVAADITLNENSERIVTDPNLINASGIISLKIKLTGAGSVNASATRTESHKSGKVSATGFLEASFANGEKLAGPIEMGVILNDQNTKMALLLDLKTSQGALRIVIEKDGGQTKSFVNGLPGDDVLKQLGFGDILQSVN
ncbi:MAG TPA: hypothetical protein VN132_07120 [Bdellovibrio sp.]|nr:hypothetical protein [Bdellovibrio sp.]